MAEESNSRSKKPLGGWRAVKFILGNETFEKVASLSLSVNMVVYLKNKYNMDGFILVNVINIWNGSISITSIIGAVLSDMCLGRYRTLLFGSITTLLGMVTMTLTAAVPKLRPPPCVDGANCVDPKSWQLAILYAGLTCMAIGAGGIRPVNMAFGADQFDTTTIMGRKQLESFFNWWYFSFTSSLLISLTGVVFIQTNISWLLGLIVPTACLSISIMIFIIGHHAYVLKKPQGCVFVDLAKVMNAAIRKRRLRASGSSFYDPDGHSRTAKFRCLDKAAILAKEGELDEQGKPKNSWRLCSVQQVENLKLFLGMMPVLVAGIAAFMIMDQQNTIGVLQAIQTNRKLNSSFNIPPGWLGVSSMIMLATWIFSYEIIWVLQTKRITGKAKRLSVAQRINMGLVSAVACSVVASVVEKQRRNEALKQNSFVSPMSIFMLLPQFALSGLVEALAAVAVLEYLTVQLPESMRTVAGAIFIVSLSFASYSNSILINIVHQTTSKVGNNPWLGGHDLNNNKLENFYYLSASLGVLNLLYFNFFARRFIISVKEPQESQNNKENQTVEVA